MGARDLQEPQRNDILVSIRLAKGTALSLANQVPEANPVPDCGTDDAQSLGENVAVEVEEAFLRLARHLLRGEGLWAGGRVVHARYRVAE